MREYGFYESILECHHICLHVWVGIESFHCWDWWEDTNTLTWNTFICKIVIFTKHAEILHKTDPTNLSEKYYVGVCR